MKLFNNDYREIFLEDKLDFILCDIPYNIGTNAYASNPRWWNNGNYKEGKSEKAESKFFETDENFPIDDLLLYIIQNLKENCSAIIFCSIEELSEIIQKYKIFGFKKYLPLVFIKNNSAEVLKANMRIVGACEYGIQLFNGKLGKFNNNKKMIKNWFEFKNVTNKVHPNEKPVELLEQFINLFTNEGETVLDMCMGSGTTGIACKNTNRHFIGIEKDEKYFNIAKERLTK